jgi:hypothetical protein
MTPEQALKILDEAVASIGGTRQQHAVAMQAVEVLKKALTLLPDLTPPEGEE